MIKKTDREGKTIHVCLEAGRMILWIFMNLAYHYSG